MEAGKQEVIIVGRPEFTLSGRQQVVVTDVHIPFGSLVGLLVKLAIAAIPALIILSLLGLFVSAVFLGIFHKA